MNSFGLNTTNSNTQRPRLGIIGGSGMCSFPELNVLSRARPKTRYGQPSDDILICEYHDQVVAFLPRHGSKHALAPHKVPYKANVAALKEIGVEYVIGTCVVGSLKKEIVPGDVVLPDQFVNLTWGRDDYSEADNGSFVHLPMREPYCWNLRQKIFKMANSIDIPVIEQGVVAVIQGPRFSTAAESRWLSMNGWDIVNMTQYPECYFARELGLCYAVIATVTDYDVGLQENLAFGSSKTDAILCIFKENIQKTKRLLLTIIEQQAHEFSCGCAAAAARTYYEEGL